MRETPRQFTRRNLPHWQVEGATYFVTFRLFTGMLSDNERQLVLSHVTEGDRKHYRLAAAVVMPDHCHLLLRPFEAYSMSRIMKGIKGGSARRLNQWRGVSGLVWHDESWDRVVRDWGEFEEKLRYVVENPVRAGLVARPEDYQAMYRSSDI